MKVEIQSVKFDADKKLVDFIQAKMNKMDRFVENALSSQVTLKIDKDDEQGNKVAVVKIDVRRRRAFGRTAIKSFERRSIFVWMQSKNRSISIRKNAVNRSGK